MGLGINNKKKGVMADINVTPLVDVSLVLLIIFMVTAPLMFNGIMLQLPKTKRVQNLQLTKEQVILSVSGTEELYIGNQKYLMSEISGKIREEFKRTSTQILYIRADYSLRYGKVARLMSYLKNAGITDIALVTEIEK